MSPDVVAVFAAFPPAMRALLMEMRELIFDAAKASGTGPLTETLKWGQPAYLTETTGAGTTLRLGVASDEHCALYVHCQTDIIERARQIFPDEFTYQTTRAVLVPATGPYPQAALQQIAAMALTYHRDKRAQDRSG